MNRIKLFLYPTVIFPNYLALTGFLLTTYGIIRFQVHQGAIYLVWLKILPHASIVALSLFLPAFFSNFVRARIKSEKYKNLWFYIGVAVISITYTFAQSLIEPIVHANTPEYFGLINRAYVRNYFPLWGTIAIMGFLHTRIRSEIEEKNAALTLVKAQNKVLIESEERSRATVANFLHDRVQTALVTVTMQLAEISKKIAPTERSKINSIIAEMEHIRGVDVRTAAQRLSPDLSVVGLAAALQLCVDALKPAIRSKIYISSAAQEWVKPSSSRAQIHLGIYRIVEQATLNAAIHGRAQNVLIYIDINKVEGSDRVLIDVINDGASVAIETVPGSGSAITAGWLSILGGESDLSNAEDTKVKLHLEIPLER